MLIQNLKTAVLFITASVLSLVACKSKKADSSVSVLPHTDMVISEPKKVLTTMQDSLQIEGLEVATIGGGCFCCCDFVVQEVAVVMGKS